MSFDESTAALHSVAIHLLRHIRTHDSESGLSPSRLSALSVVVFLGPIRLGELAEVEQVQPPTMSVLIRAMEEAGLVQRRPDPTDGRGVLVTATPAGREVLEAARIRRLRRLDELLAPLDQRQKRTVAEAVSILKGLLDSGEPY